MFIKQILEINWLQFKWIFTVNVSCGLYSMNLTKHHNFPVPVSKSKTKKFYAFLPNFETENLFSKSCSRKIGNYLENRELFGKSGTIRKIGNFSENREHLLLFIMLSHSLVSLSSLSLSLTHSNSLLFWFSCLYAPLSPLHTLSNFFLFLSALLTLFILTKLHFVFRFLNLAFYDYFGLSLSLFLSLSLSLSLSHTLSHTLSLSLCLSLHKIDLTFHRSFDPSKYHFIRLFLLVSALLFVRLSACM
jgi:hypothetical protein